MTTLYTEDPAEAAAFVRRGELAAFPTEKVYGLGADVFNEEAVRRIFEAKGRPGNNPLIAHIADVSQVEDVAEQLTSAAELLIKAFFPGPITVVLPKHYRVPDAATGGLGTIGVRMPQHELASAFLSAVGQAVVAPSANRSGRPSPTSWEAVAADLDGRIACVLKGGRTDAGIESTVVDCTGPVPMVLRPGVITLERLREVAPETMSGAGDPELLRRSPGTSYRHYAPRARVVLASAPPLHIANGKAAWIGLEAPARPAEFQTMRVCATPVAYAHELFDFFRTADAAGADVIYCQEVAPVGLGAALMDRLSRAAKG